MAYLADLIDAERIGAGPQGRYKARAALEEAYVRYPTLDRSRVSRPILLSGVFCMGFSLTGEP
jgi:hypothetical protein